MCDNFAQWHDGPGAEMPVFCGYYEGKLISMGETLMERFAQEKALSQINEAGRSPSLEWGILRSLLIIRSGVVLIVARSVLALGLSLRWVTLARPVLRLRLGLPLRLMSDLFIGAIGIVVTWTIVARLRLTAVLVGTRILLVVISRWRVTLIGTIALLLVTLVGVGILLGLLMLIEILAAPVDRAARVLADFGAIDFDRCAVTVAIDGEPSCHESAANHQANDEQVSHRAIRELVGQSVK